MKVASRAIPGSPEPRDRAAPLAKLGRDGCRNFSMGGNIKEKRILIPNTDLSVYPIGLGTVDAGLRWDGADAGYEWLLA